MDKYVFAITGPTGAGKSTVSNIMRKLGVYVIDADSIAHNITNSNQQCIAEIREFFGDAVFTHGAINRKKLSEIVFSDDEKLKLLNEITHKYIKTQIEYEIKNCDAGIVAIDGAVIIGSPVFNLIEKVVVVTADDSLRQSRIMARDNIDSETALKRMQSQMTCSQYEEYADFIIKNNDDVRLGECIEGIYRNIKDFSEAKRKKNS